MPMHTDEYEISLLKEVAVCRGYIEALQNTLRQLEKKYNLTSDEAMKVNGSDPAPDAGGDLARWRDACHALAAWEKRKSEYEGLHRQMKK